MDYSKHRFRVEMKAHPREVGPDGLIAEHKLCCLHHGLDPFAYASVHLIDTYGETRRILRVPVEVV